MYIHSNKTDIYIYIRYKPDFSIINLTRFPWTYSIINLSRFPDPGCSSRDEETKIFLRVTAPRLAKDTDDSILKSRSCNNILHENQERADLPWK
jgi:hypothetical protein